MKVCRASQSTFGPAPAAAASPKTVLPPAASAWSPVTRDEALAADTAYALLVVGVANTNATAPSANAADKIARLLVTLFILHSVGEHFYLRVAQLFVDGYFYIYLLLLYWLVLVASNLGEHSDIRYMFR